MHVSFSDSEMQLVRMLWKHPMRVYLDLGGFMPKVYPSKSQINTLDFIGFDCGHLSYTTLFVL